MNDEEEFDDISDDWDDDDWGIVLPKKGPIDKVFYPFDSDKPFNSCTMCQTNFEEDTDFLIEKAVKGNDVIFELAMCLPCAENMRKQLSKDSLKRIEDYMSVVDFEKRDSHFLETQSDHIEDYIGNCLVSGKPIGTNDEHQIYAYCQGKEMIYSVLPYAISGEVMEDIQELLSPETRREMDDFMDQYLIPDDLRDLIKGRPVFV